MRLLLLALCFISTSALAVEYKFTGDDRYQILRDSNGGAVCWSWSNKVCDVPAGTYSLFKHASRTTEQVVIQEPVAKSTAREECHYSFSYPSQSCIVACPAGQKIKRIRTCYAESKNGQELIGTNFSSTDVRAWCNVGAYAEPFRVISEVECE